MKCENLELLPGGLLKLPESYLLDLGIKDQVLCCLEEEVIVIRPFYNEIKSESKKLLDELRKDGFEGEALLNEYKRIKKASKP